MMHVSSRERLSVKDALADTRLPGRTIAILVPSFTECPVCGYDELHDSGFDPSCATCGGLGRTATWAVVNIYANVRFVDQALITFGQKPPGAKIGSTFMTIGLRDYDTLMQVYNNKDSYLFVDSLTFRPTSTPSAAGLGQVEEYVIALESFAPVFRATGY